VEGAPLALSRAGAEKIERDPEFRLAVAKVNDAFDEVTRKYETPSEARNRQSVEYDRLEAARRAMKTLYGRLTRREIAQEYKRATVNTAAPRDQEPAGLGLTTANLDNPVGLQSSVHDSSSSAVDLPESNEHHLETSNNDTSNLTNSFDSSDEDALLQDPRTLDRSMEAQMLETFNSMAVDDRTDDGHGDHSEGDQRGKTAATDTAESVIEGFEDGRARKQPSKEDDTRLHGLYRFRKRQRLGAGSHFETQVLRSHHFDTIYKTVTEGSLSDVEIWDMMSPFFKTVHPLERYGNHLAPLPGTFICPTCSVDLSNEIDFESHVMKCRSKSQKALADQLFHGQVDAAMQKPCSWRPYATKVDLCGKSFTDRQAFILHCMEHTRRKATSVCKFGKCATRSPSVQMNSRDDWNNHLAEHHGLTCSKSSKDSLFYCGFCDDFVMLGIAGPAAKIAHYEIHMNEALESAQKHGYNAVRTEVRGQFLLTTRLPWLCIFCVHDSNLDAKDRLSNCNEIVFDDTSSNRVSHLKTHIEAIKGLVHCPASAASGADYPLCSSGSIFRRDELLYHLEEIHCIFDLDALSHKRKKKFQVTDDEAEDKPSSKKRSQRTTSGVLIERSPNVGSSKGAQKAELASDD
jgi:hypothetical protein